MRVTHRKVLSVKGIVSDSIQMPAQAAMLDRSHSRKPVADPQAATIVVTYSHPPPSHGLRWMHSIHHQPYAQMNFNHIHKGFFFHPRSSHPSPPRPAPSNATPVVSAIDPPPPPRTLRHLDCQSRYLRFKPYDLHCTTEVRPSPHTMSQTSPSCVALRPANRR